MILEQRHLHHAPFHLLGFASPHIFADPTLQDGGFVSVLALIIEAGMDDHHHGSGFNR